MTELIIRRKRIKAYAVKSSFSYLLEPMRPNRTHGWGNNTYANKQRFRIIQSNREARELIAYLQKIEKGEYRYEIQPLSSQVTT